MDRNTVIGLILMGVIFIGMSFYNTNRTKKAFEKEIVLADSLYRAGDYTSARASYTRALRLSRNNPRLISKISSIDSILNASVMEAKKTTSDSTLLQTVAKQEKGLSAKRADSTTLENQYGSFAQAAKGENRFITLENELVKIRISTRGGRVYSAELKNYKRWDGQPLVLFDGDSTYFGFNFFARNRNISTNDMYFIPQTEAEYIVAGKDSARLSLRLMAGNNKYIEYHYVLGPSTYMLNYTVRFVGMNEEITDRTSYIDLDWDIYVPQQEKGATNETNYTTIAYKYYQDEMDQLNSRAKGGVEEVIRNKISWIAFKQQFFATVLIANQPLLGATVKLNKLEANTRYLKNFRAEISVPYESIQSQSYPMAFYFGPNHYRTLKKFDLGLEDLVTLGGWLVRWINLLLIIPIFNFLHSFIGNYGIIILLLTIIIKILLLPLTHRSFLSTAKMKVLKPYVDEINGKYPKKEDAMKKQQAVMDLYKKAGVSPLGGCLPMLLQFPILYAMFRFFPTSIELRQQSFLWATDLSTYDSILKLPFTIPMYGDHVSLFTLLMTASTILSTKMSDQTSASSSQMPGMKSMMYLMPIMFMLILNNFSAALTYYYFLANVITLAQNWITKKYFIDEEAILRKMEDNKKKPAPKSKFQQRLEKMAKQRGYQLPKK